MNQIKTMLGKELLEHRIVVRLPMFLALFALVNFIFMVTFTDNLTFNIQYSGLENWPAMRQPDTFAGVVGSINFIVAGIVSLVSFFAYCTKTLSKERKEGSWAFWQMMPVSDSKFILVKLAFALIIIPLISSLLLFFSDIVVWSLAHWFLPKDILLFNAVSLTAIMAHYGLFLSTMTAMSFALLPVACLLFIVSQFTDHPLIVLFITVVLIKLSSHMLFGSNLVGDWLSSVYNLPFNILISGAPWGTLMNIGMGSLFVLAAISLGLFITNVKVRKELI